MRKGKRVTKRQRLKYFTLEEKRKLLGFLEGRPEVRRSWMMYKLMFATGLRLAEAVGLNVGDVQGKENLVVIGKGRKEREIPLSASIRQEIQSFLVWKGAREEAVSPEAPLFVSRKGGRLGCRAVQHDLDKWVRLAGIEGKYSPHALRHTVGFELMRKTRNIRQVQEFLGHSSITTTQIYTHVTKEELRECAELLSDS